jgi:hypothetical protein
MYNRDKKEKRIIDDSLLFLAHKIFFCQVSARTPSGLSRLDCPPKYFILFFFNLI